MTGASRVSRVIGIILAAVTVDAALDAPVTIGVCLNLEHTEPPGPQ